MFESRKLKVHMLGKSIMVESGCGGREAVGLILANASPLIPLSLHWLSPYPLLRYKVDEHEAMM